MSLDAAFEESENAAAAAVRALENLLWAVVEAKPLEGGHSLAELYEDLATDLSGVAREAAAAVGAVRAGRYRLEAAELYAFTGAFHERVARLVRRFCNEMVDIHHLDLLNTLAAERGGEWSKWVLGVKDALVGCQQPLWAAEAALLHCWQELFDRVTLPKTEMATTRNVKI